ncbi:MAG: aa3-type cytochrome c oxidase subunit IV [Trueperaceae bacterium]
MMKAKRIEGMGEQEHKQEQEHKHGEMDIEVQEKTFEGFVKFATWSVVGIVVFLIFLAILGA